MVTANRRINWPLVDMEGRPVATVKYVKCADCGEPVIDDFPSKLEHASKHCQNCRGSFR